MDKMEFLYSLLMLTIPLLFSGTLCMSKDFESRQLEIAIRMVDSYVNNSAFAREYDKLFEGIPSINVTNETVADAFPCEKINSSHQKPSSVHKLRPGDIDVIAAIGDSLTAGRGAAGGILNLLVDNRGLSWSGGGDGTYAKTKTLANILREYNPNLYGYATGSGTRDKSKSHLNVAKSGAVSSATLEQAEILVERLKNDPKVDINNDWKLITVFIGTNDLCDFCADEHKYSASNFKKNIESALDYLHKNVPRAFVNVVGVIDPILVKELGKGLLCNAIHLFVCDCVVLGSAEQLEKLTNLRKNYLTALQDLALSGRYDTREDFTVVNQPFYDDTVPPRKNDGSIDYSYFASDCFHESKKGQEAASRALWNNMFEPVGSKTTVWTKFETLSCPTESKPFLETSKNSTKIV